MGAYLSEPKLEKESYDESLSHMDYGGSGMQGWRVSMEDAHCTLPNVDGKNNDLFAVFDGHGGDEVAKYCAENFHKFLLDSDAYREGDIKTALKDSFMNIDQALTSDEVIEELKAIGGFKESPEDDVEEAAMLLEEANMPIEELLARIKENVKEKLTENGILAEEGDDEEDEKDGETKEEEKKSVNGVKSDEKLTNGQSTEMNGDTKTTNGKSRSRKQKQPVKRTEDSGEILGGSGGGSSSGTAEKGDSGSSSVPADQKPATTEDESGSGGSSSVGGSSSAGGSSTSSAEAGGAGSAVTAVDEEDDVENDDPDYKLKDVGEEESDEEDEDSEDDGSEDDEEDSEDEFEDAEGVEFQQGAGEEVGKDSGTTAIIALVHQNKLYVANVGDSRCVLCRKGTSFDMSIDHKPEDEVEKNRIEAAGAKITMDGRVNGGLNLTRAIGDHAYKQNQDLPPEEQAITALPDIRETELTKDDDFMVLACDGIWNVMTSEEVIDFVKERLTAEEKSNEKNKLSKICEELFDRCIAPDTQNDGTGCDNMTCMIVRFKHDNKPQQQENGHAKKRELSTDDNEGEENSKQKFKKAKTS